MLVGELHIMTRAPQIPYIYETGSTPGNCLGDPGGIWSPCQLHQIDPPSHITNFLLKKIIQQSPRSWGRLQFGYGGQQSLHLSAFDPPPPRRALYSPLVRI